MMCKGGRYHLARGLAVVVALLLLLGAGWEIHGRVRSQALLDNLLRAPIEDVPTAVTDMASYRRWLDGRSAIPTPRRRRRATPASSCMPAWRCCRWTRVRWTTSTGRLLTAEPHEVIVLRGELRPHAEMLNERLWAVLENPKSTPGQRLRAACTLAGYAEDDERWPKVSRDVAARLVGRMPW